MLEEVQAAREASELVGNRIDAAQACLRRTESHLEKANKRIQDALEDQHKAEADCQEAREAGADKEVGDGGKDKGGNTG